MSDPLYDEDKDRFDEARRVQADETSDAYEKYQDKHVDEENPDSEKNFKKAFDADDELQDSKDTVDKAESDEIDALNSQLGDELGSLDEEGVDYFKTGKGKLVSGTFTAKALMSGGKGKRNAIILTGIAGIVLGFGGFLGFLNTFRLKGFMENVNFHAFSRYNAAVDRRSDAWTRAYFKTRMMEWGDGERKADENGNTFFRSNKVDTNHPFTDWYRTMRTSKFEQNLLEKHGIRFTSVVDGNGRVRPGKITIGDNSVDIVPDGLDADGDAQFILMDDLVLDQRKFDSLLVGVDGKLTEVFETDKDARKAIKKAVDSETKKWQVIKRRHTRKSIANMTGVRDWRFFDKTRTKYENKKTEFQKKMIQKVFPKDGRGQSFLLCVLGLGGCAANTDPSNPDNKKGTGSGLPADKPDSDNPVDADGDGVSDGFDPVDGSDYDGAGKLAREGAEEIAEEALEEGAELSEKKFRKELIEKITKQFSGSLGGGGPGAIKKILDWALKFETNLAKNGTTGRSKIGDSVYQARIASAVLAFSTLAIMVDQQQSGEVDPDQLNQAMQYMNGLGQSEAMSVLTTGQGFPENVGQTRGVVAQPNSGGILEDFFMGTALAQGATEAQAGELVDKCKSGEPFDSDDVIPLCENLKPNGGTRISGLEDAWNKYVTNSPLGAIIDGYRELKDNAITGFFMSVLDALGDVASKVITPILEATGLTNVIGDVAGWLAERVLSWIGVMPCMTGTESLGGMPANCVLAGAAGAAEGATRAAGGILSIVDGDASYLYSKQLAVEYINEQRDFMSTPERYFSLNSSQSFASQFAMQLSSDTTLKGFASMFSVKNIASSSFSMFSSIFQGKALAADGDSGFIDVTSFSGVDKYSIPKQCIELDPLDPDYVAKSSNNPNISKDATILGNDEAYSAALYSENGDSLDEGELKAISETYNCMALDNVVKGGLGYLNGYEADEGFSSSGPAANAGGTSQTGLIAGIPVEGQETTSIPCQESTTSSFLRIEDEAYLKGVKYRINLCKVHGFFINSIVSKNFDDMFSAMKTAGYNPVANDGASGAFRTMQGQIDCYNSPGGPNRCAKPGFSNHQFGAAVDISCENSDGSKKYVAGTGRYRAEFLKNNTKYPCLDWLHKNSINYGLLLQCDGKGSDGGEIRGDSGGCEWWHISTTGG